MSFDMDFAWRDPEKALPAEAFWDYFLSRPFYDVLSDGSGVIYHNPYTGVYFYFDIGVDLNQDLEHELTLLSSDPEAEGESPEAYAQQKQEIESLLKYRWTPVRFIVNYGRPYTFTLEADVELQALVEHFDLLVYSFEAPPSVPLPHEYLSEWFRAIWGYGQGRTAEAFTKVIGADRQQFILQDVEAVWRWNYAVSRNALAPGQGFVPRIRYVRYAGEIYTAAVWRPGPTLLPQVAWVVAGPADLEEPEALEKVLSGDGVRWLPWEEVAPLLPASAWRTGPVPSCWLDDPGLIERLKDRFQRAPQPEGSLEIKSSADVLWGC